MPNTYEATDPKTGQKWTWDGKKWNAVAPATGVDKFGMDVATGMGFDAGKIRSAYGSGGTWGQVKEIGSELGTGLKSYAGNVLKDPAHIIDPLNAMASGITHGLGLPDKPGEGFHAPVPGELLGSSAMVLGGAEGAGKVPKVSGKAALRDVLGVGEKDVESFTKKAATKEDAAHAKALEKVEKAKESYAGAVSEALKKRAAASAKETAAKVKQEALTSKHGPVYQRMNEMADTAQEHVGAIEQKVNKTEAAKWEAFKDRMGDPPVQSQATVEAITNAKKNILTGESVPVFNQILNEVIKDEGGAKDFIDTAGGLVPKTSEIPLSLARRLYTKIGRKLGGSELPKDVARAFGSVSDALDSSIAKSVVNRGNEIADFSKQYDVNVRPPSAPGLVSFQDRVTGASIEMKEGFTEAELAEKLKTKRAEIAASSGSDVAATKAKSAGQKQIEGGAEALRDYRKLQADWKQYRQTFSDRDSPLRKIMEAKDPSTKLGPITGETGARAIEYLGRYRDLGAQPEQLGKIRALHKALKEVPSGSGKVPEMPARPGLPEVPTKKTVTPQAARETMLEGKSQFYSRPPSKWELMFPPLLAYKQTLKHLMQSPSFRKWLASDKSTPVP